MMGRIAIALGLLAAASAGASAQAASPAGVAVSVNQNAAANGTGGQRVLTANASIFTGDRIATDARGQAQLQFADDTRMIVGPNSDLTIDKFVFAGPASAQQVTVNATIGAFRFITGNSAKSAYEIKTPVATIGVRGTAFDIDVQQGGTATVMVYPLAGGAASEIYYCDDTKRPRECIIVEGDCSMVIFAPRQDPNVVANIYQRTTLMQQRFPFTQRPVRLAPGFGVLSASCEHYDPTAIDPLTQTPTKEPPEPPPVEECRNCDLG